MITMIDKRSPETRIKQIQHYRANKDLNTVIAELIDKLKEKIRE